MKVVLKPVTLCPDIYGIILSAIHEHNHNPIIIIHIYIFNVTFMGIIIPMFTTQLILKYNANDFIGQHSY